VQLENVTLPRYLNDFRVLLLSYQGMKPLEAAVHTHLAEWVKQGGILVVCDDDSDPYNRVTEWWNSDGLKYATPREHLFEQLAAAKTPGPAPTDWRCGKGRVLWLRENPAKLAASAAGDEQVLAAVKQAAGWAKLRWRTTNYLLLQRGPYWIAAGLDESIAGEPKTLRGRFVNLFDPELRVQQTVRLTAGQRFLLRDLNADRWCWPRRAKRSSPPAKSNRSPWPWKVSHAHRLSFWCARPNRRAPLCWTDNP
jgi:hypothetical protein